jgi:hypothetical protein
MAMHGTTSGQKRVFVTSQSYAGTVAASVCQTVAESVNLGGSWTAWLSSSASGTSYDAIDEITGSGPWVRLDGVVVFANHAQLATAPTVQIDVTEAGQKVVGAAVWTGTLTGGRHAVDTCYGWQSTTYNGSIGDITTTAAWTAAGNSYSCSSGTAHVYCFEQ